MPDPVENYLEEYRKKFHQDMAKKEEAAKIEEEVANLGAPIIDRGAKEILARFDIDFDELDSKNEQLNEKLQKKLGEIHEKLKLPPSEIIDQRQKYKEFIKTRPQSGLKGLIEPSGMEISCHTHGSCTPSSTCVRDCSHDERQRRIYPHVAAKGVGNSEMRYSEVVCEFTFRHTPESDTEGFGEISPHIEWSGRYAVRREYHCYSTADGTGTFIDVSMSHAIPDRGLVFRWQSLDLTVPYDGLRIDGASWPRYVPWMIGGIPHVYHIRFVLRVNARSKFGSGQLVFAPGEDNYIEIPEISTWP